MEMKVRKNEQNNRDNMWKIEMKEWKNEHIK